MTTKPIQPTAEARFWSYVNTDTPHGCWEWTRGLDTGGYGVFYAGRKRRAHRLAWELQVGPIPEGKQVLHKCDNRVCVRPAHLYLGDHVQNQRDALDRGRHRTLHGSANGNAKLSDDDVAQIRSLRGKVRQIDLAARFGVGRATIQRVQNYERYLHESPPLSRAEARRLVLGRFLKMTGSLCANEIAKEEGIPGNDLPYLREIIEEVKRELVRKYRALGLLPGEEGS